MAEARGTAPLLLHGLRRAMSAGELEILFQPQVDVQSGRIVGAEALARWQQPHFGEVGAEALFGIAARADLFDEVSEHVQERAVLAARGWPQALSHLHLSINVTAADTTNPGFADQLLRMVQHIGFPANRLTIEVTETELIENLDCAALMLERLRGEGIRVALDDFGTGYSSLLYLKTLPLDAIKIDRRLTEDISGSERDRIVVKSVIAMARALDLQVIAEGVETEEQLDLLRAEGCSLYQGFLCSPPISSARLADLVSLNQ